MSKCNCSSDTPLNYTYTVLNSSGTGSTTCTDSSTINFSGPNLTNIGIDTNSSVQAILEAIDTALGEIAGIDWSTFDYSCLDDSITINSAQLFVETISEYVCNLDASITLLSGTTIPEAIANLEGNITTATEPGITSCTAVGIVPSDNVAAALEKLSTATCSIFSSINPSSANWNSCYTVSPAPTTIVGGFNTLINQICTVKGIAEGAATLPTFNNINSCLPTPSATESLESTVTKIRNLLCTTPTFDIDDVTWASCITNPNAGGGADLLSIFNKIIAYLDATFKLRINDFDTSYFTTTLSDPGDPCSGYDITLATGIPDSKVALNASDSSPDYLLNKITAGTNISFDTATSPGEVIIECDAEDTKVKADSGDTDSGYLIDKVEGATDGTSAVTITESYNSTDDKVTITPSINYTALATQLLSQIESDNTLLTTFNALVCAAQPCTEATRYVYGVISVAETSTTAQFNISSTQASPTLAFFSTGDVTMAAGESINTGGFEVTSASLPVTGTLTITNNDSGAELPYSITVVDGDSIAVPGGTIQSGTLAASSSVTINPFTYGSDTNMYVNIVLGDALTTTTTTSTTTTTTTLP